MAIKRLVTWLCFAVLSLIGLSLQQKADLKLEVENRYIQVRPRTPVTLTCTLSDGDGERVPLAGCGFRHYESEAAWDIGTGSATINNTIWKSKTSALITSNPEGDAGICSLKIEGLTMSWSPYILGCRVKPVSSEGWRYATMMVHVDNWTTQQYRLQPPGVLVSLPGSDVSITGMAEHQVTACILTLPPNFTVVSLDSDTSENTTQHSAWREGRRCGVTLLSVQPSWSGFVQTLVASASAHRSRSSVDFVELIVATPPVSPPLLSVNTTGASFQEGDMLHATCVVEGSRPVSNITWLWGGEVIREDDLNEAPVESAWLWNHDLQPILQRLSRRLTQEDDGKKLICRAGHIALLSGPLESNSHIVLFGAKSPAGP